ncbi:MAG: hypothetical protein AAGG50_13815 [Bacteroidota bacterium]
MQVSPSAPPKATGDGAAPPPRRRVLGFDPKRDGFAFTNHFVWADADVGFLADQLAPLVATTGGALGGLTGRLAARTGLLGTTLSAAAGAGAAAWQAELLVGSVARQWASFGLCGGMALAAAERWPLQAGLPTAKLERERVRALLRRRQARTLRAAWKPFVRYWLAARLRPDAVPYAPFGDDLMAAYRHTQQRIDAGRPVVLGLVGDAPDLFAQHQVVCFGYADHDGVAGGTLLVYDPNRPGETKTITVEAFGSRPRRCFIQTDIETGPQPDGRYFVSKRHHHLSMVFVVNA